MANIRTPRRLTKFALLILTLVMAGNLRAAQQNVLILGDSIGAAYGMSLEQGWVSLLQEKLIAQNIDRHIINASISGETTAGGLKRLPALLAEYSPQHVIVELGGNDGLRGYPLGLFEENLTAIVETAKESGAQVLLLPMEIPPNYGARYTKGFRQTYDKVAATTQSMLGPFILLDVATRVALMQDDGIHPTAAAQPAIVEAIYPALLRFLDIQ